MAQDTDFETVILSACRTPVGAFGGVFKDVSAVDLGAVTVKAPAAVAVTRSRHTIRLIERTLILTSCRLGGDRFRGAWRRGGASQTVGGWPQDAGAARDL